jgi:hypothetical protein
LETAVVAREPYQQGVAVIRRRTLTGYYIGVLVVLAILNSVAWLVDAPPRHDLGVFSAGFLMGALGMYIAAYLYGYRK